MSKVKQLGWLVLRFSVLGPLAMVATVGVWAEAAFEYLDKKIGPNDSEG